MCATLKRLMLMEGVPTRILFMLGCLQNEKSLCVGAQRVNPYVWVPQWRSLLCNPPRNESWCQCVSPQRKYPYVWCLTQSILMNGIQGIVYVRVCVLKEYILLCAFPKRTSLYAWRPQGQLTMRGIHWTISYVWIRNQIPFVWGLQRMYPYARNLQNKTW